VYNEFEGILKEMVMA